MLLIWRGECRKGTKESHELKSYISGVLDLFLPLKNSGRARRSMAWTLQEKLQRIQKVLRGWGERSPEGVRS